MNRQSRRSATKTDAAETIKKLENEWKYEKERADRIADKLQQEHEQLFEANRLIAQLTAQVQDGGKSYMWTLGAIALANGGEIRIPCSAIDSVKEDDVISSRLDEMNDCIVFTIRPKGASAPSGIILPGRARQ